MLLRSVIQQIHFLSTISDNEAEGHKWVYNSYDDWQKQFPFWSKPTIVRIFKRLKDADLIVTGNYNKRSYDRTKWYRSEEHTSELQSRGHLVCRLLLEKKNKT